MLAIRFCEGKPQALVLIEVKCTSDACSGKSGIQKHINGMDAYSKNPIFIRSRLRDAQKCMEQYQKIGFIPESYKIPDFSKLPVERVFILTVGQGGNRSTGAVGYYVKHKDNIELKETKIMYTENLWEDAVVKWNCFHLD